MFDLKGGSANVRKGEKFMPAFTFAAEYMDKFQSWKGDPKGLKDAMMIWMISRMKGQDIKVDSRGKPLQILENQPTPLDAFTENFMRVWNENFAKQQLATQTANGGVNIGVQASTHLQGNVGQINPKDKLLNYFR